MRDEHCHIIWGVDDGSDSRETTQRMLSQAIAVGVSHIVCTPHMRWSTFDQAAVEQRFQEFSRMAAERGVGTTLGYEVFFATLMSKGIEHAPLFVEQGTNNLLVEFNTGDEVPFDWEQVFYRLQSTYGLDITVAHPERYTTVLANFDVVYRMKDMGCRIQVSAGDLFAGFLNPIGACAKRIVAEGLCDALVSDAHRPEHYRSYAKARAKYAR